MFVGSRRAGTVAATVALAAALCTQLVPALRAQAPNLPGVWIASPRQTARLALPVHFDEFSIQPPSGMEMTVHRNDGGASDVVTWRPPGASDGYGGLKLTVQNSGEANATDAVVDWLTSVAEPSVTGLTHSDIETGSIYGTTFARAYYKGTENGGTRLVHGFVYIGIAGRRMFILEAADREPRSVSTLPIAETSTLTLRIAPTQSVE